MLSLKNIVPMQQCVIDILTCFLDQRNNIYAQIEEILDDDYMDGIKELFKSKNNSIQKNWLTSYQNLIKTKQTSNICILDMDISYLKNIKKDMNQTFLKSWLLELDGYHQQQEIHTNHKLLASNMTYVLLRVEPKSNDKKDESVSLPLYQSIYYQNDRFQDKDIISYPSVSNLFDLFDDKWYNAIESANIAAFNEFGYKLANPNGQLVIRWAIDLSDYYSTIGIDENNAHKMIEPMEFPRTISDYSAGSAFAVSVLQLLARAYLNHDFLFSLKKLNTSSK